MVKFNQGISMSDHKTHAIQYLYQQALADKSKAELSFDLLLNKAVGIGDHSTGDFHENLRKLNTIPPSIEPTATGHILEQIELIER